MTDNQLNMHPAMCQLLSQAVQASNGLEVAAYALDSISSWLVPDPGIGGADAAGGLWL